MPANDETESLSYLVRAIAASNIQASPAGPRDHLKILDINTFKRLILEHGR